MEESSKAQKFQILSDWRSRFSPNELRLLVVQLDSLVELAKQEGAKCPSCGEELECSTSKCPHFGGQPNTGLQRMRCTCRKNFEGGVIAVDPNCPLVVSAHR
jgi:hypothetical protein